MRKNLIPEICKILGIEPGEKFKLDIDGEIYQITEKSMFRKKMNDEGAFDMWEEVPCSFIKLLSGDAKIIKLPWKPKMYEEYWTFGKLGCKWTLRTDSWKACPYEILLLDKGWIYRTRAEAETALPSVAAEMGVEYD